MVKHECPQCRRIWECIYTECNSPYRSDCPDCSILVEKKIEMIEKKEI